MTSEQAFKLKELIETYSKAVHTATVIDESAFSGHANKIKYKTLMEEAKVNLDSYIETLIGE
ncbi:hypothetical protein F1_0105 [Escherichia phage vB_EcoM_F1]|uniref:Uncharacterized protein n=1 Tax=Escherichia phage vB_EcoM_F1 TaxID=2750846 RepID=A0A7D5FQL7_9CAUD|nr:helicase loader [Escherichia phage vB_EcoM_F1]QXV86053.1 hypothetical protein bas35_0216 [Escherichia phage WilhelmHis]QYW00464.1 hypothetical protein FN1NEW_0105 [Escherichia phage vB_EcoM_FN]QZI81221.1 hypothetical protein CHD94UKE2_283 [Escherichia phage vB_EcoM-CHD94UKE2]QZI81960.1 hypothetical protein G3F7_283 [Escherichia phage vB_EcoM-G3F7]QZI82829.1 hypothetical protein G3F10_282 [Escherichia phage vB_EcoM-G3F10]UJP29600.1 hypothetical protein UAB60_gp101 [Salmonella phage UAB_60]